MLYIDYPSDELLIKKSDKGDIIFDEIRRKWLLMTPEEWVRQNFIQFLLKKMNYPASLIAVEKKIRLGELSKRCDIVVYKDEKPWMIIECKEMNAIINQSILEQVIRYNMAIPSQYLVITNGVHTYAFERVKDHLRECNFMPEYTV